MYLIAVDDPNICDITTTEYAVNGTSGETYNVTLYHQVEDAVWFTVGQEDLQLEYMQQSHIDLVELVTDVDLNVLKVILIYLIILV